MIKEKNGNITIGIIDEDKFDERAEEVNTEGCFIVNYGGSLCVKGSIRIGDEVITGQHGFRDYEEEYGFILLNE